MLIKDNYSMAAAVGAETDMAYAKGLEIGVSAAGSSIPYRRQNARECISLILMEP
jgi:hypothetical protein